MKPTEHTLEESGIRRCAFPLMFSGGPRAVLGLHGYTGYPGELYYPAERLHKAGFTVSVPRLPGHGTSGNDFNRSSGSQWLRKALDCYLELSSLHEEVYVMGHSMGGLLALLTASVFPVRKIALMAPAVSFHQPLFLTELFSLFINKSLKNPLWEPDNAIQFRDIRDAEDDVYLGQEYWTWSFFKRMADLSRLKRQTVKQMPRITGDVLTIMGGLDTTVSMKSASVIEKRVCGSVRTVVLPQSGHLVPYDKEFEKNGNLIVDWFV